MTTHLAQLFKLKKNQIFMLRDRGYTIDENETRLLAATVDEFLRYYEEVARARQLKVDNTGERQRAYDHIYQALSHFYQHADGSILLVYYARPTKSKQLDVEEIKQFTMEVNTRGVPSAMLISRQQLSSKAKDEFSKITIRQLRLFLDEELFYNLTEHYLVPKHRVLSDDEAKDFLTSNRLRTNQLPILKWDDPVSKWYGFIPGQIVEVLRENLAAETLVDEYRSYRFVDEPAIEKPSR